MHVLTKCFAIMYAIIPMKIADPGPGIFGHSFPFFHLGIWAFVQKLLDTISQKEDIQAGLS